MGKTIMLVAGIVTIDEFFENQKKPLTFRELDAMEFWHPWHKLWAPWNAKDDFKVLSGRTPIRDTKADTSVPKPRQVRRAILPVAAKRRFQ